MNQKPREILFFHPIFKQIFWGGDRLGKEWPYQIPGDDTGECWGISAHPNGDCIVREGAYAGKKLSELWNEEPALFGNLKTDRFPLLVKIIDAKTDLSIQVHPDNTYAKQHENGSLGKTECWYVLSCDEDAKMIIGHNAATRQELCSMIRENRWNELLREVPVKKGDVIQINPGTIHALKAGLMILEIQQNSDITYRVYDYGRALNGKQRELHLEKSIDVITVPAAPVGESVTTPGDLPDNRMNPLMECRFYRIWKLNVTEPVTLPQEYPFLVMSVIEGSGTIDEKPVKKGDHFILPADYGEFHLEGKMQIIASTV